MIAASVYLRPEHPVTSDVVNLVLRFGDTEIHYSRDLDTALAQIEDTQKSLRGLWEHVDALIRDQAVSADRLAARLLNADNATTNAQPFGTASHASSHVVRIPVQGNEPEDAA